MNYKYLRIIYLWLHKSMNYTNPYITQIHELYISMNSTYTSIIQIHKFHIYINYTNS